MKVYHVPCPPVPPGHGIPRAPWLVVLARSYSIIGWEAYVEIPFAEELAGKKIVIWWKGEKAEVELPRDKCIIYVVR